MTTGDGPWLGSPLPDAEHGVTLLARVAAATGGDPEGGIPMAFPDPSIPIATCKASDCAECPVADSVHCHFRPVELAHFLLICMPTFLVGGAGVLAVGLTPLLIWIAIFVVFFNVVEIRVLCSHCPHYAEQGATLGCWAIMALRSFGSTGRDRCQLPRKRYCSVALRWCGDIHSHSLSSPVFGFSSGSMCFSPPVST